MLHDLFWALYWIDVLSSLPEALAGGMILGLMAGTLVMIMRHGMMGIEKVLHRYWVIPVTVVLSGALFGAMVPSKSTMYMMLGVRATDNFTQTEMGKKLSAYIEQEMDKLLNKGERK